MFWFRKAAEAGDPAGEMSLGACLQAGEGVEKDEKEAVEWYRKAAVAGVAEAEFNLGRCFQQGSGTAIDEAEAFKWFSSAAAKGLPLAEFEAGLCHWHGRGTAVDLPEAYAWMSLAARRGIPNASQMAEELKSEMSAEQLENGAARLEGVDPNHASAKSEKVEIETIIEPKFAPQ